MWWHTPSIQHWAGQGSMMRGLKSFLAMHCVVGQPALCETLSAHSTAAISYAAKAFWNILSSPTAFSGSLPTRLPLRLSDLQRRALGTLPVWRLMAPTMPGGPMGEDSWGHPASCPHGGALHSPWLLTSKQSLSQEPKPLSCNFCRVGGEQKTPERQVGKNCPHCKPQSPPLSPIFPTS